MLKSYLDDEKKHGLSQNALYAMESAAADEAGDDETALAWLRKVDIPAHTLMAVKKTLGADWIRRHGLKTETADRAYGPDWLDR